MQEYQNSNEIIQISELYETNKVKNFLKLGDQPMSFNFSCSSI